MDRPEGPPGLGGGGEGNPGLLAATALTRKSLCVSLRSVNAAGSCLIKELLFTTKLRRSQVSAPRALLDCQLPGGRGCDIKQTQICQGHRLEHLLQLDTARANQPAGGVSIPHGSVAVKYSRTADPHVHRARLNREYKNQKRSSLATFKVNSLTSSLTSPGFLMFYLTLSRHRPASCIVLVRGAKASI